MSYIENGYSLMAKGIIAGLARRNMEGFYCENGNDAVELAISMMEKGARIAWGGSASVTECGLMDAISSEDYVLIDRMNATTEEEKRNIFAQTVLSDYYLMSTNAITLDGELVNIDGNGNRLAALIHGPKHVILIVGMNKVATDLDAAMKRVRLNACPPNAIRLNKNTPCAKTGKCGDCLSPDCFCNQIVITRRSGHQGRIKVILVGESLGY